MIGSTRSTTRLRSVSRPKSTVNLPTSRASGDLPASPARSAPGPRQEKIGQSSSPTGQLGALVFTRRKQDGQSCSSCCLGCRRSAPSPRDVDFFVLVVVVVVLDGDHAVLQDLVEIGFDVVVGDELVVVVVLVVVALLATRPGRIDLDVVIVVDDRIVVVTADCVVVIVVEFRVDDRRRRRDRPRRVRPLALRPRPRSARPSSISSVVASSRVVLRQPIAARSIGGELSDSERSIV